MFTTGTVLSIITCAERPGSAAVPISVVVFWAAKSLTLILFRPFGRPVVSSSSPSQ